MAAMVPVTDYLVDYSGLLWSVLLNMYGFVSLVDCSKELGIFLVCLCLVRYVGLLVRLTYSEWQFLVFVRFICNVKGCNKKNEAADTLNFFWPNI